MKTIAFLTLLLAGASALSAAPPVKQPVVRPGVTPLTPGSTVFDDWALGGVSEVEGGYMVTLVNKKNQGETQIIKPRGTVHNSKDEMKWINPGALGSFRVEKVEYGKKDWKDTTVLISSGDESATMKFDDKQLAPPAATAARPPSDAGAPGVPPQIQSGRPPRQRVSPPAPTTQSRPTR
jgi:hypothetical protein